MGYFNFDFEKYRPSTSQGKPLQPKGLVTPTPQQPQVNLQPQQVSQPSAQFVPQPEEDKSLMQKVFDVLAKPSELTQSFLTGGRTYEEALKERGVSEPVRNVLGFTGRLALDPLNLIPIAKIGQAARLVSKIPGIAGGAKAVSKAGDIAGDIVSKIPVPKVSMEDRIFKPGLTTIGGVKENLSQKFIRGYKLPETYNILKSEIPTTVGRGAAEIVQRTKEQFGEAVGLRGKIFGKTGTTKFSQPIVEAIPKFLEPKGAGSGINLGALRQELGEETFKKIRPVLRQVKEQFDSDIVDLVKRGRMTGETAKRLLNQGGYYPHTDFAPQRIKEYFVRPKIGERRTYLERRKGAEGFTFNAPKAIARRELSQFQDNVIQDFFREVRNKFGVKIGTGQPMPEGYVQFLSDSRRTQELKGWALPARISQDINASISSGGDLGRAIDTFNNLWKPTATSLNPAFHIMNVVGNLYNSWLGGMKDPRRFLQAIKGGFSADDVAILKRTGILDRGQFGGDLVARTFDNPQGLDTINVFKPFRRFGEFFENNARGAFLLDQRNKFLRQGLSDAEATRKAVQKVNEYLFDYLTGLTPFETNIMRRVFPFYTWARFNIPLQFKSLVTQPEKVALVSKLNKELNKAGNPEGDQEGITIPTPFVDSNGNPIRYRPNLPVQDIFNMNLTRFGSMVNPAIKELANLGLYTFGGQQTITDPFTGREITNKNLPVKTQIEDIAGSRAKALLRPVRTFTKFTEEEFSPAAIARGIVGGTYTIPREAIELRKIGKKQAVNRAINDRIRQIHRDPNMTREEKLEQIEELLRSRQ